MSIESKANFLMTMEQRLASAVTAADMTKVLELISDTLANYDMTLMDTGNGIPDDLLDAYIAALTVQGRSEKTIERYKYEIGRMRDVVKVPTRQITVYHLRGYLAKGKERGLSDGTLDGQRQVLQAYFNWLARECLIQQNPAANLGTIKRKKKVKDLFTEADIERLKTFSKCKRDKAIICFLLSSGARISEVVGLNRDSIDFSRLECKVLGKGNKERTVYLDTVAAMTLQEYLAERTDDDPALFVATTTKKRLKPGGVRCMLKLLGKESGVSNVHPHKFRRTFCTTMLRRGMSIQEVAAILGHEKIDTTMQYCVLDNAMVKSSYAKLA